MTDFSAKIRNGRIAAEKRMNAGQLFDKSQRYERMAAAAYKEYQRFSDLAWKAHNDACDLQDEAFRLEGASA